jgi:prevent-host-death family protein
MGKETQKVTAELEAGDHRTVAISEARERLPELVETVFYKGQRILIERRGKVMAVLISLNDFEFFERMEQEDDAALSAAVSRDLAAEEVGGESKTLEEVAAELEISLPPRG